MSRRIINSLDRVAIRCSVPPSCGDYGIIFQPYSIHQYEPGMQAGELSRVRDSYGATRSVFFFVPLFWVLIYTQIRRPTMPDSLPALEAERSQILRPLSTLGDLGPGSMGAAARRCGKPT